MKLQNKCMEVFALVDVWTMVCLLIQNWTAFFFFHVKFIMNIQTKKTLGETFPL